MGLFSRFWLFELDHLAVRERHAPVHSAGGLAQLLPRPATRADTQEPMSPITGASMATLLSISVGAMSIWMNFFGPLSAPQVLP